ncbi:CPBP family intramembrane metalloprotease [Streptobacillus felis]|uniref:CPBP family intramembrane metalloprotease n=1 Tax=Streptobacillus felis TaxID=1384509 RepID=A0A7Z0TAW7_9FUSO|nr:type II CAAX endopeptidase family protein [Streptobacillus felis]NYV28432.1 CPBP family intramembrane metalloprotease [Streptobacillus felis]
MLKNLSKKQRIIFVCYIIVAFFITQFIAGFVFGVVSALKDDGNLDTYSILILSNLLNIFFIKNIFSKYGINIFKDKKNKLLEILVVIIISAIFNISLGFIINYFKLSTSNQEALEIMMQGKNIVYIIIGSAVIVPIAEELLFRGVFANLFSNKKINFIISVLFFTIMHGPKNIIEFIPYFLMGILFTGTYFYTGSLKLAMLAHIVNNFLAMLSFYFKN